DRLAGNPGSRRRARSGPPLLLPAHRPRGDALRPPAGARRPPRAAGARPGRALRPHPRLPRRRRLPRLRGVELRPLARPSLAAQPEVLGPYALPRARPLCALLRRRAALVERAPSGGLRGEGRQGRAAGRRRRRSGAGGPGPGGADAGPADDGRDRPRELPTALPGRALRGGAPAPPP